MQNKKQYSFRERKEIENREIIEAINVELSATPRFLDFIIISKRKIGHIWSLELKEESGKRLEDSFEESKCWWRISDNETGVAEVLSVILEKSTINIRFYTAEPPDVLKYIRIYPPIYFEKLKQLWETNALSNRFINSIQFNQKFPYNNKFSLNSENFPTLRKMQREAFKLTGWETGFLWGPPGTGKTFTLAAMLAQYILQFPRNKVLLLSTTNNAVDHSLIALDSALENQGHSPSGLRKKCLRIGNHYLAKNYENRKHLLPVKNDNFLKLLVQLEKEKPDKEDVINYSRWKNSISNIRNKIKSRTVIVLKDAKVAAMTTTFAVFQYNLLEDFSYDLVVFDEVSQVGLAHSLPLAFLGRKKIYTGDFMQLSPIVKSSLKISQKWLGKSVFDKIKKDEKWFCRLEEQSRMSNNICNLVSNAYYNGNLRVADDVKKKDDWFKERNLNKVNFLSDDEVTFIINEEDGIWSQKYKGPIRFTSAEKIKNIIIELLKNINADKILVLTPFHAQRVLINQMLRKEKIKGIDVSTVHKAQGSERHTIIFDPVDGGNQFLAGNKRRSQQLVNVAISRAKARLIIFLSDGDLENEIFNSLYFCYLASKNPNIDFIPICNFINNNKILKNIEQKYVNINGIETFVIQISESRLVAYEYSSGKRKTFGIEQVIQINKGVSDIEIEQEELCH